MLSGVGEPIKVLLTMPGHLSETCRWQGLFIRAGSWFTGQNARVSQAKAGLATGRELHDPRSISKSIFGPRR